MPRKRFSVAALRRDGLVKAARVESLGAGSYLLAVIRSWGSAFWAFEGWMWFLIFFINAHFFLFLIHLCVYDVYGVSCCFVRR